MQAYLCGRQIFVIITVYLVAQITSFPDMDSLPGLGKLPDWFMAIVFKTGLPGALIVVACGQLIPQLLGEEYPITLMRLPLAPQVTKGALILHSMGLTHFALLVTLCVKRLFGLTGSNQRYSYQIYFSRESRLEMLEYAKNIVRQRDQLIDFAIDLEEGACPQWRELSSMITATNAEDFNLQEFETKMNNLAIPVDDSGGLLVNISPQNDELWCGVSSNDNGSNEGTSNPFHPYPSPYQLAQRCRSENKSIPRFLLPPGAAGHVPPHVVAYELMRQMDATEVSVGEADPAASRAHTKSQS